MLTLLSELKFLTSRDEILVKENDYGTFKSSNEFSTSSDQNKNFLEAKREYSKNRGLYSHTIKKNANKLKQLEEELKTRKVITCFWTNERTFMLMLANGLIIFNEIDIYTGNIKKISFDKYFIGKLISENVCDIIYTRQHILISYDVNQITYVHLQKPSLQDSTLRISDADPKIFNVIIGGPVKKLTRNLIINISNDLLLIWTNSSQNEFFPWRPSVKEQERANLHIYKLSRIKFEPICYFWTESSPVGFEFSKFSENEVRSVEQKISRKGDVTVESCTYHISSSKQKLQRISVTSIPLQTEVSCCVFSPDQEKLVMGCIDGSIVLFDEARNVTLLVRASFIPTLISFHPDNAIFVIANERGQLQFFDISLACVKNQLLSEDLMPSNILDLSSFFVRQPSLMKINWSKKADFNHFHEKFAQVDGFLLLLFDGALATSRFIGGAGLKNDIHTAGLTHDVLIHMYLSLNQIEKAINFYLNMNWDSYGAMCLLSLHKIANYLFKLPATAEREELLEKALGSFHVPPKALCSETENEFGDNVADITLRFFHYLIRHKSFQKAYRLAIDINDKDLFMILHKCSKAHGFIELANEALRRADEIFAEEDEEEFNSHHSTCSISSCSICTSSSEESESDNFEKPFDKDNNNIKSQDQVDESKSEMSALRNVPPLPTFHNFDLDSQLSNQSKANELSILGKSQLTQRNLQKLNKLSSDKGFKAIDQTVGIPLMTGNEFTHRIGTSQMYASFSTEEIREQMQHHSLGPTVHNYPLISGSIPSLSIHSHIPMLNNPHKKDMQVSSILSNVNATNNNASKKENGEKNKVKFSDTVTIAVMKDNSQERLKRKSFLPTSSIDGFSSRKELAESLPLCHPHQDYLKDFMPATERGSKIEEKKSKSSIKVVNFGLL